MFIILDSWTEGSSQWRKGHETVNNECDEVTNLFTNKAFATIDEAKDYITKFFLGRSEHTINWNDHIIGGINYPSAFVTESFGEWEDEDGKVGGSDWKEHRIRIEAIELAH